MDFQCPSCGESVRIGDGYAGHRICCPHCRQTATASTTPTSLNDNPFEAVADWAEESDHKRAQTRELNREREAKEYAKAAPERRLNRAWGALLLSIGMTIMAATFMLYELCDEPWKWYAMSREFAYALRTAAFCGGVCVGFRMLVSGARE